MFLTSESLSLEQISDSLADVRLHRALPAVVTFAAGLLIAKALLVLVKRSMARTRLDKSAASLIRSVLKVVLYALVLLMSLSRLGVDVSGVVALASVASLALSLSLQDSLSNIIGGFMLLYTHPFKSGDYVEIAGQAGSVQSIDITYTKLTTPDNKVISIPNSTVVSSQIVNFSASGTRRIDISVAIGYEADPAAVKAALLRAADLPQVLTEPAAPLAAIRSYQQSNLEYVLQVWTNSADYWPTTFAINENIRRELQAADIPLTYPHVNVHMHP